MKNRFLPILIACIVLTAVVSCAVLATQKNKKTDTVRLNELLAEVEKNAGDYSGIDSLGYNIVIIDFSGAVLYADTDPPQKSYEEWLNHAYKNSYVILDFSQGKILVAPNENSVIDTAVLAAALFSTVLIALLVLYHAYVQKTMFKPFRRLQRFAGEIAAGNLDKPLPMDKNNLFGAFSESFDIMRAALKKSKEKEAELEKSKSRLVAELSHDIKTPVASIQAVAEVLKLNEPDEKKTKKLSVIQQKAAEIDRLISDLFNATLEDLAELKINVGVLSSQEVARIVKEADYRDKIDAVEIPDCLVLADALRLSQAAGNILNNSYKYAGTAVTVGARIADDTLGITFTDAGGGVAEEDLPLIANRFYRGKNGQNTSGAGLGLYICKTVLERMGGCMDCHNTKNGFAVTIWLKLA